MDNNDKRRSRLRDLMNGNNNEQEPEKPKPIMGRMKVSPDFKNKDLEEVNTLKEVKAMTNDIRRPSNLEDIPRYAKETLEVLTRHLAKFNLPADDYKSVSNQFTAELLNTINNHLKTITDRKEDVNSLRQEFKELQEKTGDLERRNKSLESDFKLTTTRNIEYTSKNNNLLIENAKLASVNATLFNQINERNIELEKLQTQETELQTSVNSLTTQETELQTSVNSLTKLEEELQTSVDSLTSKKTELQTSVDELTSKKTELQTSVENTLTMLNKVEELKHKREWELNDLTNQRDSVQAMKDNLQSEVAELEVSKEEINNELLTKKEELDKINLEHKNKVNHSNLLQSQIVEMELNLNKIKNEQATYDLINSLPQLFVDTMKFNSEDIKSHVVESLEKVKGEGVSEIKEHITSNTSNVDIGSSLEPLQQDVKELNNKLEEINGNVVTNRMTEKAMRMQSMQNEALLAEIADKDKIIIKKENTINDLGATASVLMDINKIKDALAFKPEILKKSYLILMNSIGIPSNIAEPIYNQSGGYAEMLDRSARLVIDNPHKWYKVAEYFANINSVDNQSLYIPTADTLHILNDEKVKETLIKFRALREEIVSGHIKKYVIDQDRLRDIDTVEISDEDKLNLSQSSKAITGNLLKENLNSSLIPIIDNIVRRVTEGHEVAYLTYNLFAIAETPLSELSDTAIYVNPIHKDILSDNLPILKSLLPNIRGYRNPRDLMGELESVLPYVNETWVIDKFVGYLNENFKKDNYKYNLTGVGDDFSAPLKRQDTNILIASQGDFAEVIKDNIIFMLNNSRASLNKVDGSTNPMSEVVYLVPALISIKEGTINE